MRARTKALIVAATVGAAVAGYGFVGGDDDATDTPITGPALQQASDAAIAHLGGGTVTGTEVGDEESFYEVEVTRDDGTQVDVQLDEQFTVVGTEEDGSGEDD